MIFISCKAEKFSVMGRIKYIRGFTSALKDNQIIWNGKSPTYERFLLQMCYILFQYCCYIKKPLYLKFFFKSSLARQIFIRLCCHQWNEKFICNLLLKFKRYKLSVMKHWHKWGWSWTMVSISCSQVVVQFLCLPRIYFD